MKRAEGRRMGRNLHPSTPTRPRPRPPKSRMDASWLFCSIRLLSPENLRTSVIGFKEHDASATGPTSLWAMSLKARLRVHRWASFSLTYGVLKGCFGCRPSFKMDHPGAMSNLQAKAFDPCVICPARGSFYRVSHS